MICYNMQESMVSTKLECEQVKDVLTANIQGEKKLCPFHTGGLGVELDTIIYNVMEKKESGI